MRLHAVCRHTSPVTLLLETTDSGCRELLYLDLALEDVVRAAAERGAAASGTAAAAFVGPLLQNLALSGERGWCR